MTRLFAGTPFDRPPHCERCDKLEAECVCPPVPQASQLLPPEKQTARLSLEKRKKGKLVTVIRGLAPQSNDLQGLLTQAKNHCGAGGTLAEDGVEIQGDQIAKLQALLSKIGYRVR